MVTLWVISCSVAMLQVTSDGPSQLSQSFGGPHGSEFSDQHAVVGGATVSSIKIRAGARIDGITLEISAPNPLTFTHGYDGVSDTMNTLQLEPGEYIKSMEAHWDKNRHTGQHTRIFYLNFVTSAGKSISGGTPTAFIGSVTAPEGYQLAGFFGRDNSDGGNIDMLGAVWAPLPVVETTPPTVTPVSFPELGDADAGASLDGSQSSTTLGSGSVAAIEITGLPSSGSTDSPGSMASGGPLYSSASPSTAAPAPSGPATQLSEQFGGPHGIEFSDQSLATSGQTVSSIAIRAGARIDGITLTVTAPTAHAFVHGFDGVSDTNNALSLNTGEYIQSMEVHWDKNSKTKDQTCVFYLNFITSAGRAVAAGSKTDRSATISAPEGYQLGGFIGRADENIDLLGVVWTSIAAVSNPPSTEALGTATNGIKGDC